MSSKKEPSKPEKVKTMRVSYLHEKIDYVPYIRFRGHWLERCGFLAGTTFRVEASAGQVVLTLIEEEPGKRVLRETPKWILLHRQLAKEQKLADALNAAQEKREKRAARKRR
ncbi:MAG: type I toxin-antitoxin system SymE family toxin [Acidobacteriota bacterium]|nr:type I toxin-antitoxin system SymE family toxin [Acidobacteriota bacterium]